MVLNSSAARPIVVLVSGRGSNLQSLIAAQACGGIPAGIKAVISNRPEALALERARRAGIAAEVVDHTAFPDRAAFDRELMARIEVYRPGLIAMAGFMRILSHDFITHYEGRMLNIHPSLLPDFRGLDTHRRALEAGVEYHGCSVHFVTNDLDAGPVVIQAMVKVHPGEDPVMLAARVLKREHVIYPMAVRWFCDGRLELNAGTAHMDGAPLKQPVMLAEEDD